MQIQIDRESARLFPVTEQIFGKILVDSTASSFPGVATPRHHQLETLLCCGGDEAKEWDSASMAHPMRQQIEGSLATMKEIRQRF